MPEKKSTAKARTPKGFTTEERAAMQDHVKELRAEQRGATKVSAEEAVLAKIVELSESDRAMAERIHTIITLSVPELAPKLWYGMPAYARDGDVVCFFQPAQKFKTRYSTLGFSDKAALDDGQMWPTSFALNDLSTDDEGRIAALVRKAARR